jgi:replicative DNA helicase
MGELEEKILTLSQQQATKGFTTILDAIVETGGVDDYMDKMCDPKELTGLATGFVDVDKVWGGMQPKNLIIIAARPSMGKSALLFNMAVNVVTDDHDAVVALFSVEMSKEAFFKRIVASVAEVSARRAQEGMISIAEKTRMTVAVMKLAELQLHIDDTPDITTMQMRAKARRLKQQHGRLDLIGIDYLQLMKGVGKHGNRQEEVSSISRGLKAMSKELDCPVVALAQLSRKNEERGDKRPIMSDLRESGSIEQDADIVAFIHRAEYYAADDDENVERGTAEIITAKNRDGQTGTRKLAYRGEFTKFSNLELHRGDYHAD